MSTSARVVVPLAASSRSEQALVSLADPQGQISIQKRGSDRDLGPQYIRAQRYSYLDFRDASTHKFRPPMHQKYASDSGGLVFLPLPTVLCWFLVVIHSGNSFLPKKIVRGWCF